MPTGTAFDAVIALVAFLIWSRFVFLAYIPASAMLWWWYKSSNSKRAATWAAGLFILVSELFAFQLIFLVLDLDF